MSRHSPESSSTRRRKPKFAPVTLSEQEGVRYLHFGTEWIQGAMRLRKPDWIELEYAQQMMTWMLFIEQPKRIVQLGLGAAALTKFCRRWYPRSAITAVELNPSVIDICHSMFKLPIADDLLEIIEGDAGDFVEDRANHGTIDVLQIDLYDATARGPVLESPEFYRACARCPPFLTFWVLGCATVVVVEGAVPSQERQTWQTTKSIWKQQRAKGWTSK
mgnify:CR=1 FL=1